MNSHAANTAGPLAVEVTINKAVSKLGLSHCRLETP